MTSTSWCILAGVLVTSSSGCHHGPPTCSGAFEQAAEHLPELRDRRMIDLAVSDCERGPYSAAHRTCIAGALTADALIACHKDAQTESWNHLGTK